MLSFFNELCNSLRYYNLRYFPRHQTLLTSNKTKSHVKAPVSGLFKALKDEAIVQVHD